MMDQADTRDSERCPHCNGEGGGNAFINRGPDISTHSVEWVRCRTCEGAGVISGERAVLVAQGKAMRDARVARQETLLEAARKMGITPSRLSAIERGRAD
jgi:DnaJ-class molecular chaperone